MVRTLTGIEIAASRCALVSAQPGPGGSRVRDFRLLAYPPWSAAEFEGELTQLVRSKTFSRHARMVVWPQRSLHARFVLRPGRGSVLGAALGHARETIPEFARWAGRAMANVSIVGRTPDGTCDVILAAADRDEVRARVLAFRRAGFIIDSVTTPALALEALSRTRAAEQDEITAYLVLHAEQAALAITSRGVLLEARELPCRYPIEPEDTRERLLQRYTFVSALGPEIRRTLERVKHDHGATVQRVVACGSLANLRSLTAPLIEELDLEVEVLDSLDGIDPLAVPEPREQFCEMVATLRLAWSVAVEPPAVNLWAGELGRVRIPRRAVLVGTGALATSAAIAAILGYVAVAVPTRPPLELIAAGRRATPAPPAGIDDVSAHGSPQGLKPALPAQVTPQDVQTQAGEPGILRPAELKPAPDGTGPADVPEQRAAGAPDVVPLAAPVDRARPRPPLAVASILFAGDRQLALVNGQVVRVGDRVGSYEVVEILPSAVVFRDTSARIVRVPISGGGS